MQILYVAGPYRADTPAGIEKNIAKAAKVAKKYWRKGYAVLCPHMNSAHFDNVVSDKQFLEADLEFLKHCDIIVMLPDWEYSTGSRGEHDLALKLGIEVIYE